MKKKVFHVKVQTFTKVTYKIEAFSRTHALQRLESQEVDYPHDRLLVIEGERILNEVLSIKAIKEI